MKGITLEKLALVLAHYKRKLLLVKTVYAAIYQVALRIPNATCSMSR